MLGEELLETVAKNFDEGTDAIDEIDKVIRSLKRQEHRKILLRNL